MNVKCISIAKPEERALNEDAVIAREDVIAVSDGAGGGGVFAEVWSQYLLDKLPSKPLEAFNDLDAWIDNNWEPYYNQQEAIAQQMNDPMLLSKFYDEGSFATLVAIWRNDNRVQWMSYGDSVAFCYNPSTECLMYSIGALADFGDAPYLISCKDPLQQAGFKAGEFELESQNIYFVASDALAHYILMMYMVAHKEHFERELQDALSAHNRNANYIRVAMSLEPVAFTGILRKLLNCVGNRQNMSRHLAKLRRAHLLAVDDYSLAVMQGVADKVAEG